jgi:hypothetical protein
MKMKRHILVAGIGILAAGAWADADAAGVQIECLIDVPPAIRNDDSLNDVFPQVDWHLIEGRVAANLVDGWDEPRSERWRRSNNIVVTYENGPAHITFDLGPSVDPDKARLDSLTVWMNGKARNWGEKKPTFDGRLLTSRDGETFTPIPGSEARLMEADSEQFNAVHWSFDPGAVKGFRYLQVELRPTGTGPLRIEEIDGMISGVEPERSTVIRTGVTGIPLDGATVDPPAISQHIPEPMQVEPLAFDGLSVIRPETGQAVARLEALWKPGEEWRRTEELLEPRLLYGRWEREDGLTRVVRSTLEPDHRLVVECEVSLPESAPAAVRYDAMALPLEEGEFPFEGVAFMGPSAYYRNRKERTIQLGQILGYVVYPVGNMEMHVFMPHSYTKAGVCESFRDDTLNRFVLYSAVDNTIANESANTAKAKEQNIQEFHGKTWIPAPGTVQPGETLRGRFHAALFQQAKRRTIGRIDLEDRPPSKGPLTWINTSGTGTGDGERLLDASYRCTTDEKLRFMGMPMPVKNHTGKPGHMINDAASLINEPGVVDRLRRGGFGVACLMMRDFYDGGHGVSFQADYNNVPSEFEEVLDKLTEAGIRPVIWFSPSWFWNENSKRKQDPIFHEHPDWFRSFATWGGTLQLVNIFKEAPNRWMASKLQSDFRRFPELGGVAFDGFPHRQPFIDVDEVTGRKMSYSELAMAWLKRYHNAIKTVRPDAWIMHNTAIPMGEEYQWIDFGVSEASQNQIVNQVVPGRAPFGRVHGVHRGWSQLYQWMVTLSFMHHNFANFDQGLGWFHHQWLGWHPDPQRAWMSGKKALDEEVVPLWYLMGKGRRMYVAETAPFIKQTEVRMPDGGIRIVLSSFSPCAQDIDVVPRHLPAGAYRVSGTIDTCLEHQSIEPFDADTSHEAIRLTRLPGYGIAVLRFDPVAPHVGV